MPVDPSYFGVDDFAFPVVVGGGGIPGAGTLSALANGDGTVTVSMDGGTPGDVVSVYGGNFSSSLLTSGADLFGVLTVAGDGTATATWATASGVYTFVAISAGVPIGFARAYVFAPEDILAAAFRAEIRNRIIGLSLFQDVQSQMTPDGSNLDMPGVILTPFGVSETDEGQLSATDDTGFPTRVMICDREDKYDHDLLPNYEFMRQEIVREFRDQQLDTRQESFICRVEFGTIIDVAERNPEYLVSELLIRAVGREPRHHY